MESKFNVFWNFQKKKTGEVMITEEELQRMLDAAYDAGYNQSIAATTFPFTTRNRSHRNRPVPDSPVTFRVGVPGRIVLAIQK